MPIWEKFLTNAKTLVIINKSSYCFLNVGKHTVRFFVAILLFSEHGSSVERVNKCLDLVNVELSVVVDRLTRCCPLSALPPCHWTRVYRAPTRGRFVPAAYKLHMIGGFRCLPHCYRLRLMSIVASGVLLFRRLLASWKQSSVYRLMEWWVRLV